MKAPSSNRSGDAGARRVLNLLVLCCTFIGGFVAPASSQPVARKPLDRAQVATRAQSGGGDRLVYSSRPCFTSSDCTYGLFTVALDGSEPQPLFSTDGTDDTYAEFSPDGTEIAFTSWDVIWGCDSHIWLMKADGSDPHMISSPTNSWDESLGWAPDGSIAFTRWPNGPTCEYGSGPAGTGKAEGHGDLYLLSRTAEAWTEEPLLTRPGSEYAPAFSPDGQRIAYSYDADKDGIYSPGESKQRDIWTSRSDGTRHKRLTRTPRIMEGHPTWSPDGKRIAFSRGTNDFWFWQPQGSAQIWTMRPDGSHMHRLTPKGYLDVTPAWSPDGTRIAFSRCTTGHDGGCSIAVINVARPRHVQIVVKGEHGSMNITPAWEPATGS